MKRKQTEEELRLTAADLQELRSEKEQIEDTQKVFAKNEKDTQNQIEALTEQIQDLEGITGGSDDDDDDGGDTGAAAGGASGPDSPDAPDAGAASGAATGPGGFFFY